eukprot:9499730-Pyramimonas_sp.AAC.1
MGEADDAESTHAGDSSGEDEDPTFPGYASEAEEEDPWASETAFRPAANVAAAPPSPAEVPAVAP